MLLSGHRVPREDEEPCVICGGFYKQRRAWKWWDEILAKGRNEKSIRNAFPLSLLLFFSPLSLFGRTAAAITLLYISSFNLTQNQGAQAVRQVPGSEVRRLGATLSNITTIKANSEQGNSLTCTVLTLCVFTFFHLNVTFLQLRYG